MQNRRQKRPPRLALQPAGLSWFEMCSVLLLATLSGAGAAQSPGPAPSGRAATNARAQPSPSTVVIGTPASLRSTPLEAAFRRADRDNDGRLSRQETEHFPMLAERFEQFDRDHDGHLSRDEFQRAAQD